jgi:hypothetical protein
VRSLLFVLLAALLLCHPMARSSDSLIG